MADSPSGVLSCSVYCNGSKLKDNYALVSASVCLGLNRIGKATLKFRAGDADSRIPDKSDAEEFKPGNTIRLDAGDTGKENSLFEGIVTGVRIAAGVDSGPCITVECSDYAYPATQRKKNRIFEKKKDRDIIGTVLSDYGTVKAADTDYQHPELVQYYCTDWDFALSRADANGLFVFSQGREIRVFRPDVNATPVMTAAFGANLKNFDLELSGDGLFREYEAQSWNPQEQNTVQASASFPPLNKQGDLSPKSIAADDTLLLQADAPTALEVLKQKADSMALYAGLARYRGTCSFSGTAKAVPGCLIELRGLGKRFDGNMFAGSVRHTIENGEWTTEAGAGIPAAFAAGGTGALAGTQRMFPGPEGVHAAVVKKLDGDPLKEYRILVELPWMDGGRKELWARLSTMYATGGSACFFMPEAGDEVVVGFMNRDPGHPVVLGSLYGSRHRPPYEYEARNDKKAIVTREKMKIEFDEEKKTVTVSTPAKNRIEISDDGKSIRLSDENKNEIVMDRNGITFSSNKDIVLKAKGNITMDAAAKTTVTAKSDVSIEGSNVKVNARISASVKGSATAELSASGQTTVKGGVVMIN